MQTNKQTEEEKHSLEKFKESKLKQTLNYNITLTDLQRSSDSYVVKTQAHKRILGNIDENIKDKRQYLMKVCRRATKQTKLFLPNLFLPYLLISFY